MPSIINLIINMFTRYYVGVLVTLYVMAPRPSAKCQEIRNIVFEGAGIRGIAYVGAIQQLHDQGHLKKLERVGGTSAGAIAALTLTLGYTPGDIEKIIYDTKLQKFNDGKFFFIGGISRLNRNYGWYRGEAFTRWLAKIISDKTGNSDITFSELHSAGFPDLYVTGTSINRQRLIVFSRFSYPNMKVKDAVRISMSIPLYFQAVCIDENGSVRRKRDCKPEYDIMVDGGLSGNFPITMFDSVGTDQIRIPNKYTVGLRIDNPLQIEYDKQGQGLAPVEITRFRNYVGAFYQYVIEQLNRQTLTKEDWSRTISISSGAIGPKIRKLSLKEKSELVSNGVTAAQRYLTRNRVQP